MSELLERLWGADDLDALFGAHSRVVAPWTRAGQSRTQQRFDRDALTALLAAPATLRDVDPRTLFANQPWIVREHVAYYRTGEWERTGRTSADQWVELNRYPVIVEDHRGRSVILAGHHRSAAALLAGRPLRVRVAAIDSRSQITPSARVRPRRRTHRCGRSRGSRRGRHPAVGRHPRRRAGRARVPRSDAERDPLALVAAGR